MKSLSTIKLGAALCASTLLVPVVLAQSGGGDQTKGPAGSYAVPNPDDPTNPKMNFRERMNSEGQADASSDLDSARQMVVASEYKDRDRVLEKLQESIESSRSEQNALTNDAKKLEGEARGQFVAMAHIAGSRTEQLEESLKALEKAGEEQWNSRKRDVAISIELLSIALERERTIVRSAGSTDRIQQR